MAFIRRYFLSIVLLIGLSSCNAPGPSHSSHHHTSHNTLEHSSAFPNALTPTVNVTSHYDVEKGWTLHLDTTHFTFTPDKINQTPQAGEGHAHIFINGTQHSRIYGHWYKLDPLPTGAHTIRITLNANNHAALLFKGQPIEAVITLHQPKHKRL
jgi:hypothetical protein